MNQLSCMLQQPLHRQLTLTAHPVPLYHAQILSRWLTVTLARVVLEGHAGAESQRSYTAVLKAQDLHAWRASRVRMTVLQTFCAGSLLGAS